MMVNGLARSLIHLQGHTWHSTVRSAGLRRIAKSKSGILGQFQELISLIEKIFLLFSIYGNNTHPLGLNKGQNIHVETWRIDVDRSQ